MDYDDFDYVDGTLHDWTAKFYGVSGDEPVPVAFVVNEYLPRFEAAIHKMHSTSSRAWNHPAITRLPFNVVTADNEGHAALVQVRAEQHELATKVEAAQNDAS